MNNMNLKCNILEMNESDRFNIFFEEESVFTSEIIVCMLVYNNGSEIRNAINSIRTQKTSRSISILIVDGGISDDWKKYVESFKDIVMVKVSEYSVSQSRNLSHQISNKIFPSAKWICRLDSDDILHSTSSIEEISQRLDMEASEKNWAISGNSLSENGIRIDIPYYTSKHTN